MVEIEDGWENRWVKSDWKKNEKMAGEWNHTSGKWNGGDPNDKGSFSPPRCKHFLILMMLLKVLLLISNY